MKPEIPFGVRVTSSAGLFVSSVVSPIDSPIKTSAVAEDNCQVFIRQGFTPLQGDCDPADTVFGIFLITATGATPDMTHRLAEQGYINWPPEIRRKVTIIAEDPARIIGNMGCIFEQGVCSDGQAQHDEIDRVNRLLRSVGRAIQESVFLAKSPYDYVNSTGAAGEGRIPTVYTSINLFLSNPAKPDQNLLNYVYAKALIHEAGHSLADIDDNEGDGDVMDHNTRSLTYSPRHLARMMEKLNLGIQRYAAPSVEAKLLNPAALTADQILQPSGLSLVLGVYTSVDTTQFFSQVIPYNNDGAGIEDIIATPLAIHSWGEGGRRVPAPPNWYGLLPDMTYTWRVRTSHLAEPLTKDDQRWGQREITPGVWISVPGAEITTTFRTGKKFADNITGDAIPSDTGGIKFRWQNPDPEVFYYEVQVSKDPTFNTDPNTATAAVYHNLVHGGITNNSWELPPHLKEDGVTYYAKARPRVQGDGTPVPWSKVWVFDSAGGSAKSYNNQIVIDQRYSYLKDNPTPDFVLFGEGYKTHVYSPQKDRYGLVTDNLADRRKQIGISRGKRIKTAA